MPQTATFGVGVVRCMGPAHRRRMPNIFETYEGAIRSEDAAKASSQTAREKLVEAKALVVECGRDVTLAEIEEGRASEELASARKALQRATTGGDNRGPNRHQPKTRTTDDGLRITRKMQETIDAMPDGPITRKQLSDDLGIEARALDQRIGNIKDRGLIELKSHGAYRLTKLGRDSRTPRLRAVKR